MAGKDSMLDGFMKGLGKKLGRRRRDVHQAIARFNDELHKEEQPTASSAAEAEPAQQPQNAPKAQNTEQPDMPKESETNSEDKSAV